MGTRAAVIDHKLREIPSDIDSMNAGIAEINEYILTEENELVKAGWISRLSYYQNLIGEYDEAQTNLQNALNIFRKHRSAKQIIASKLRMAQVFQYRGNLEMALAIVDSLEEELEDEDAEYLDFILQHKGKILFDMKEYDLALHCLNDALLIREEKGDRSLIDSTLHAIKVVMSYLP